MPFIWYLISVRRITVGLEKIFGNWSNWLAFCLVHLVFCSYSFLNAYCGLPKIPKCEVFPSFILFINFSQTKFNWGWTKMFYCIQNLPLFVFWILSRQNAFGSIKFCGNQRDRIFPGRKWTTRCTTCFAAQESRASGPHGPLCCQIAEWNQLTCCQI